MCGICGMLLRNVKPEDRNRLHIEFYCASKNISHRGPDRSILTSLAHPIDVIFDFERLSIMDTSTIGDQPFRYEEGSRTVYVICNGELYNYKEICSEHNLLPESGSDCEVIPLLYKKYGYIDNTIFNSEHAFMILDVDMKTGDYKMILSSDRFGIRPLFVGWDKYGFYFSSELQGLPCLKSEDAHIERFPPRHYAIIEKKAGILGELKYHKYYNIKPEKILYTDLQICLDGIRESLEDAVIKRLQSDRPFGCLLSGGLDSSLVAAIASKYLKKSGQKLRTFCIGMPGGTDEKYAKLVAKHIDSDHTHIEVPEEDFLNAIPDIIKTIASYDITTVRASTGQYLISKWISKNTDIKVLLLGDGSDEACGSYKYFVNAPDKEAYHNECIRLLEDIHLYDGLRADRCVARFGIEARFPFLDYKFVEFILRCNPKLRMAQNGVEKWLLREAFKGTDLLPEAVRTRQKEAYSDGVSKPERSWYQIIQERAEKLYTDKELEDAKIKYKHLPPVSKESLLFKNIFCENFGNNESMIKTIPYYWLPKWCGDINEPSARILNVYKLEK